MALDKLIVVVNKQDAYFKDLLLYLGFEKEEKQQKGKGNQIREVFSISRDDFESNVDRVTEKIASKKFYNCYHAVNIGSHIDFKFDNISCRDDAPQS